MKKFQTLGCLIASTFIASVASAAPVGNPVEGHELKYDDSNFSIGFGLDFVTDREIDGGGDFEMTTYEAKIGYALNEMTEVYLTLGLGEIDASGSPESDTDLIWGIGATFALAELDNGVSIGTDFKYRSLDTEIGSADTDYQDWQIALAASKHYDWGCPYVGIKYSDFDIEQAGAADSDADDIFGIFIGLDGTFTEDLTYTIEGRFIDEEAIFVSLDYAL